MTDSPVVTSPLKQLKADAAMLREAIQQMDPSAFPSVADLASWLKDQLALNVVPLFESAVDAIEEEIVAELDDVAGQVDAILHDEGDELSEETAGQILGVFDMGKALCTLLERVTKGADQMTRRKVADAIRAYRGAELAVREVVTAITVPDEEEPPEEIEPPAEVEATAANDEAAPAEAPATTGQEG